MQGRRYRAGGVPIIVVPGGPRIRAHVLPSSRRRCACSRHGPAVPVPSRRWTVRRGPGSDSNSHRSTVPVSVSSARPPPGRGGTLLRAYGRADHSQRSSAPRPYGSQQSGRCRYTRRSRPCRRPYSARDLVQAGLPDDGLPAAGHHLAVTGSAAQQHVHVHDRTQPTSAGTWRMSLRPKRYPPEPISTAGVTGG